MSKNNDKFSFVDAVAMIATASITLGFYKIFEPLAFVAFGIVVLWLITPKS